MMDFSGARTQQAAVHLVGTRSQTVQLSIREMPLDESLADKLRDNLLVPFRNVSEKYYFTHPQSLQFNETYNFISAIFAGDDFVKQSQHIASHLHFVSEHPRIRGGELCVLRFSNVAVGDRLLDAVAIIKCENKTAIFEVNRHDGDLFLQLREGIGAGKLDKACLVVNDLRESSFPVYIIDNQNRDDAAYWTELFLQAAPAADSYHHTKNFLTVTKQFISEQLADRDDVSRMDQIKMLDESVNYFKAKEQFNIEEFNATVFDNPELIRSFRDYGNNYLREHNIALADQFEINNTAVKKQSRIFKSVLKLDRNFHIYIHGNRELIEQGFDERTGKKFYKIYFDEET